jgi:large subunit ribosomal protein L17
MNNKTGFNRLGRNASHRRALLKNLATSLIVHGKIETTQAKAKELRSFVEKLVTRARIDSVHNRRIVGKIITEKEVVKKLFNDLAPRYVGRPGGYTRIVKLGQRRGDAAPVVVIEFVDAPVAAKSEASAG